MAEVEGDDLRALRTELMDAIGSVSTDIKSLAIRIEDRYVTRDMAKSLERRVYALESQYTWTIRTIIGVVIMAVLTMVVVNPLDLSA